MVDRTRPYPVQAPAQHREPHPESPRRAPDRRSSCRVPGACLAAAIALVSFGSAQGVGPSLARAQAPAAPAVPSAPTAPSPASLTSPTPEPTPPPRVRASFDGGVGVDSADGRFGVSFGSLIQYRFSLNENAAQEMQPLFNSWNVRPQIRMHAYGDKLRVFVQPELAGTGARLLDLEITYQPHEAFRIRAGQFLTPFTRSYLTPVPLLQFVDFGAANDAFRMNRDTGVMLFGTPLHGKLEYDFGFFNGNGINQPTGDRVRMLGVGRVAWSPLGAVPYDQTIPAVRGPQPFRFSIAANGYTGRSQLVAHTIDATTGRDLPIPGVDHVYAAGGGDFVLVASNLYFQAEAYARRDNPVGAGRSVLSTGAQAQVGWTIPGAHLELAARVAYVDPAIHTGGNSLVTYEGALHYYIHGNHAKLQLRYLHANNMGAAQLGFLPGRQERVMLQTQIFF